MSESELYIPIKAGEHYKEFFSDQLGMFGSFHVDTVITTWIAMGIAIVFALIVTSSLHRVPGRLQMFAEMLMKFLDNLSISQMGKEGIRHTPLIGSLFVFILLGNFLNNIPIKLWHLPYGEFASPTNDLNTTAALALIVLVYYIGAGIRQKGLSYFKHYFQPFVFLAPFNLL